MQMCQRLEAKLAILGEALHGDKPVQIMHDDPAYKPVQIMHDDPA